MGNLHTAGEVIHFFILEIPLLKSKTHQHFGESHLSMHPS